MTARKSLHSASCCILCWVVLARLFAPSARAAEPYMPLRPFGLANQSPLTLALLPFSPTAAAVDSVGGNRFKLTTAYTNVFTVSNSTDTNLYLDMELFSVSLRYDRVLAPGMEIGLEVPFLYYYGGFLDNFVENFHETFGFPSGGRENVPHNQVRYRLRHNGRTIIDRDGPASGLGDVKIHGKFRLLTEGVNLPGVSFLAQAGFPTGREADGLGAGGPTFAAGFSADKRWGRISLNANALFFYLKETSLTDPLPVKNVIAGSFCASYSFTPSFMVMGQLNGATPLFESTDGGGGIDNSVLQLLLGFAWRVTTGNSLRFSFAEDLVQDTSPDFTVGMEWEYAF